jgi:hypothetical protein
MAKSILEIINGMSQTTPDLITSDSTPSGAVWNGTAGTQRMGNLTYDMSKFGGQTISQGPLPEVPKTGPKVGYEYMGQDGNTYNSQTGEVVKPAETTPTNLYTGGIADMTEEERAILNRMNPENFEQVDEEAVRRNQLALYQAEIDAQNGIYAEQKRQATLGGLGRLGSEGAIQARRGLLGSSFGTAQTAGVEAQNVAEQKAIDSENMAKIATIMGNMRKSVSDEITNKRKAITDTNESYIKYLSTKGETKKRIATSTIDSILQSGATVTQDELDEMAKEIGVDPVTFRKEYLKGKNEAESAAAKAEEDRKLTESKLSTELINRQKTGKDIYAPFEEGGYIYEYNSDGTFKKIEDARSVNGNNGGNNYDSKTIPKDVKADLITTITSNKKAKFSEIAEAFPEVDTKYLQEVIDSLQ